jgi:hypothetical protein
MSRTTATLILFLAATLEAGVDAIMRAAFTKLSSGKGYACFRLRVLFYLLTGGLSIRRHGTSASFSDCTSYFSS